MLSNIKYVLNFSAPFVWNIFHPKKNWPRCDKNIYCSSYKVHVILSNFNGIYFSSYFRKNTPITFHENPFSGSRVVPCGRTNGRTDMTELLVAFRNFANAPKMIFIFILRLNGWKGFKQNHTKSTKTLFFGGFGNWLCLLKFFLLLLSLQAFARVILNQHQQLIHVKYF